MFWNRVRPNQLMWPPEVGTFEWSIPPPTHPTLKTAVMVSSVVLLLAFLSGVAMHNYFFDKFHLIPASISFYNFYTQDANWCLFAAIAVAACLLVQKATTTTKLLKESGQRNPAYGALPHYCWQPLHTSFSQRWQLLYGREFYLLTCFSCTSLLASVCMMVHMNRDILWRR